jgi:hypothetical protein
MKQAADVFHFDLSLAELHWLAGAFSISHLPLPDDVMSGRTLSQLEAEQKNGHASLLTRGLVRPSPSFGWQVDRLPTAIIQWLASAQSLLRLNHIPKSGATRRIHIFTMGEQGMSVDMDADTAHFTLYETRAMLIESMIQWLAISPATKKSEKNYQLPQPQTFLPAAWKNPNLAESMLKTAGIAIKKDSITWINSLEYVSSLSRVELSGEKNKTVNQLAICGDKKSVWGGNGGENKVPFILMTIKDLTATIDKMQ